MLLINRLIEVASSRKEALSSRTCASHTSCAQALAKTRGQKLDLRILMLTTYFSTKNGSIL